MAPNPPVDRRTMLRGALWAAGAVASGTALTGCGQPTAAPVPAGAPSASGRSPGPSTNTDVPTSEADTGTGRPDGGNRSDREGPGKEQPTDAPPESPEPTDTPSTATDNDPPPDRPPEGTDGGKPGDEEPTSGHAGDHEPHPPDDGPKPPDDEPKPPDDDDPGPGDPGGPPPLVATAAVPVGGGVVLARSRVVVTQPTVGTFRCFQNRCTHAGCAVDTVADGTIHCPCHGSLFAIDSGSPVAGPAPSPLPSVPITVKSGGVFLA